jgi:RHS repeat-associated protein
VIEAYEYDPYGKHVLITDGNSDGHVDFDSSDNRDPLAGSDIGNPYMFTGREFMAETALQLNRNRFYDCQRGRWISRDPLGYVEPSLYQYGGSDPLGHSDSSGLWWLEHKGLTEDSFDRALSGGKLIPPGDKCREHMLDKLIEANKSQDSNAAFFSELYRHYNRELRPEESADAANASYTGYISRETKDFTSLMGTITGGCRNPVDSAVCTQGLRILGRLSHTWQDYYAHAVLRGGPNDGQAGPAWSANPPITGTPDELGTALKASSWHSFTDPGEHGRPPSEPAYRDGSNGSELRKNDARAFVTTKFEQYLGTWLPKCQCCCPPKK